MTALVQAGKAGLASWKTTLLGVLQFIAVLIPQVQEVIADGDFSNVDFKLLFASGSTLLALIFARDGDKSSEDVGAKK